MIGSVEDDEFDVQSGLMSGWAVTFCVLYIIVMIISIVLYLLTVRALAIEIRAHNTTYLLVMILFLTAMLEFGVVMGEFLARFGHFSFTDLNCKLLIFTRHGNRILQISTALTMLYYNWLAVYLKTTKFQLLTRRYFPLLAVALVVLMTVMVLQPTLNIKSSSAEQWCQYVHSDIQSRAREGWLYTVIFPYLLPLVLALPPSVFLALRLRAANIIEPQRSQVVVSLAVVIAYFVFYLLHFILMTARQVDFMVGPSSFHKLLGFSVIFITRPMFTLIGYIWHISVPLSVLLLDKELRNQFPGSFIIRRRAEEEDNSIVMSEVGSLDSLGARNNNLTGGKTETDISNNFSVMMLESREFHHNYNVH